MSVEQMSKVLRNSRSKGSERLVLLAMANEAHSSGELTAYGRSLRRLAHRANISERQAAISIKKLQEMGEIEVLSTGHGRESSDYMLTIPDSPLPAPPPRVRKKPRVEDPSALPRVEDPSALGGTEFIPEAKDLPPWDEDPSAPSSRSLPVSSRPLPGDAPTPQRSEPGSDTAGTRSARGDEDNEEQPPPGSSSSELSDRARAKMEPETTTNNSLSTSTPSAPEGAQQPDSPRLSNDQDEPGDLFGGPAKKPRAKGKKKPEVERWLPQFMELYPWERRGGESEVGIRRRLTDALKRARGVDIIAGLELWAEHWATCEDKYIKSSAIWFRDDLWTAPPRRPVQAAPRGPVAITVAEDPALADERPPQTEDERAQAAAVAAETRRMVKEARARSEGLTPHPDMNKERAAL